MRVPSISEPLRVYLGSDGNVWAANSADGRGYGICQAVENALATGTGSAGPIPNTVNPPQISVYDDFIQCNGWITGTQSSGNFPGLWVFGGSQPLIVGNAGTQNGIIELPNTCNFLGNFGGTPGSLSNPFPITYANISKIFFRAVCLVNNINFPANEVTLGFTHSGNNSGDTNSNLYGAFINFCPGFASANLPDWDTRVNLTNAQLNGFTWGVYNGAATAGFGYKPSVNVTAVAANVWYDVMIVMTPGVACKFYAGIYGASPPALESDLLSEFSDPQPCDLRALRQFTQCDQ